MAARKKRALKRRQATHSIAVREGDEALLKRRRFKENKRINQLVLRERMKGREYLARLTNISDEFVGISDELANRKIVPIKVLQKYRVRIDALKAGATLNLRLLDKVLPDLKALEVSDPEGNAIPIINLTVNGKPTGLFNLPKEPDIMDVEFMEDGLDNGD